MNSDKIFDSQIRCHGKFAEEIENNVIKNEPMFFNCDIDFAIMNGGPITKSFIENLPDKFLDAERPVIDTRVHMLMPGWYPAIPGYHHDDVPRPNNGQPDYDNPSYHAKHCIGLVNAEICPTEFALGRCVMPKIEEGELVYREWHKEVEKLLEERRMGHCNAPDRTIVEFDWQTFHQGRQALSNGWRWFGRVSINTDRSQKITNEIRRQVQVYMEFPLEGW